MLSDLLPSEKQLSLINDIGKDLSDKDGSRRQFVAEVAQFIRAKNLRPISSYKWTRLWKDGGGLDLRDRVAVFDFISTEYRARLRSRNDETSTNHASLIDETLAEYDAKQREQSPLHFLGTRVLQPEDARPFLGDYLGYRVSSRKGEIVRFSLSISLSGTNELTFRNIYDRDGVRWICSGGGLAQGPSLYLIGMATDQKNPSIHRGYRMLCLEIWRGTKILQGVVISRDKLGPIAARFVAIPVGSHDLDPPPGEYGDLMRDSRFSTNLSRRDWESANAIVELDKMFLSKYDYNDLEEIIGDQTLDAIQSSDLDAGDYNVWNFIANTTSTTLHGYLNRRGIDVAHDESELDEFDALVERLVERMQRTGASVRDMVHQSLKDLVDRSEPEAATGLGDANSSVSPPKTR
ncbi:MAG: hypothetical protein KF842_05200 [Caulobacter sp.]|nr:hypothetical protein [Caulobacter sp.]